MNKREMDEKERQKEAEMKWSQTASKIKNDIDELFNYVKAAIEENRRSSREYCDFLESRIKHINEYREELEKEMKALKGVRKIDNSSLKEVKKYDK